MKLPPNDRAHGGAEQLPPRQISDKWDHCRPDDIFQLQRALATGLSGTSMSVERFEELACRAYSMQHAIAVSSGSSAVQVATSIVGAAPGDEIIVPPTAPICTVVPLLSQGLVPIFCDVLPNSFGLNPHAVAQAIGPRTRAIIEVPMWGYPTPVEVLQRLAAENNLTLILDLAHAHMAQRHGRPLAHYGDVACYSMHESKFISTGEGGFVLTNRSQLAERMRAYTRFGNLDGQTFGLNFKLSGLQAALGIARLGALEKHFSARRRNRDFLLKRLTTSRVRELPTTDADTVSGYALLLQVVAGDGRRLVEHLHRLGIPSDIRKYDNRPLYEYPLLKAWQQDCPQAAALLRSLTTVPLHPDLNDDDLVYMANCINAFEA